jgi:hypothetical protein
MSESFVERRRRELGIKKTSQTSPENTRTSNNSSFVERRKMELGLIPATNNTNNDSIINPVLPPSKMGYSMADRSAEKPYVPITAETEDSNEKPKETDSRNKVEKALDWVFKENPVAATINRPFAAAAQALVPDAPMIGNRDDGSYGSLEGPSARERFVEANPIASTGNKTLDKVGDWVGKNVIAPIAPVAGPGTGIGAGYGITSKLALTKAGQTLLNKAGGIGSKAATISNKFLNNQGIHISNNLAANAGRRFVEGTAAGGLAGSGYALATTEGTGDDLLRGVQQGAMVGGALDAAGPFVGAG